MNLEQNALIVGMQHEITKALAEQHDSGFIQYDPCHRAPLDIFKIEASGAPNKKQKGVRQPLTDKEKARRVIKRRLTKKARRAGR